MNKLTIISAALIGIFIGVAAALVENQYQKGAEYVYDNTVNGVVYIISDINPVEEKYGTGTGFFIDENVIMTNNHVVDDAQAIHILMPDSAIDYAVEVIAASEIMDTALLRIKEWDKFKQEQKYSILNFAPYDPEIGQTVYTLGHPTGIPWTISEGIVSGLHRPADGPKEFIQVDAKIYQGNSGGPLLDEKGRVLGMNTLIKVADGGSYGFSIDKAYLKKTIHDLLKHGKTQFVRAGLSLKLTEDKKYVQVGEVLEGGAGQACGIEPNDIIRRVNTANGSLDLNMGDIGRLVMKFNSLNMDQTKVDFTIDRNGSIITKDCNLTLKDA